MKNITSVNQNYVFFNDQNGKEDRKKTTKEFCKEFIKFCEKEMDFYARAKQSTFSFLEEIKTQTEKTYPFPDEKELQDAKRMHKTKLENQKKEAYEKRLELFSLHDYIHNLCDMEEKYIRLYQQTKSAYNAL